MSDLISTTQDTYRDRCIELYVGMLAALDAFAERSREDRGQTAAEYMGVLLVVSAIIAAVATTDIGTTIKEQAVRLVKEIAGAPAE
jgi:pilus assembly protein Flp/PilA